MSFVSGKRESIAYMGAATEKKDLQPTKESVQYIVKRKHGLKKVKKRKRPIRKNKRRVRQLTPHAKINALAREKKKTVWTPI